VQDFAKELREGLVLVLLLGLGTSTLPAQSEATGEGDRNQQEQEGVLSIKSMGARAFGGTTIPMPEDPTDFQACDHGYTEWFIPTSARKHAMVLVHGSSARTYQTTWDGRPGFQTLFLRSKYPVYLVDLPWTGRAGKACQEYTWSPVNPGFSARFVFTNRIGLWPPNTPVSEKQFFPGSAFPRDSSSLDQFFRNQYVEFNDTMNVRIETDALAILLEQVYAQHGAGAVLHTHSVWSTVLSGIHAAQGGLAIEGYEMLKGLSGIQTHEHREWLPIIENSQYMAPLARIISDTLKQHPSAHGFLLKEHGLYTWGVDIAEARRHVEILEFLMETLVRRGEALAPRERS